MASAPRDKSMWPIAFAAPVSHRSVSTGWPDSACSVIGAMNRVAPEVITTSTPIPSFTRRRVSSAALYAAMPPVKPRTTRLNGRATDGVIAWLSSVWLRNSGATEFNMA